MTVRKNNYQKFVYGAGLMLVLLVALITALKTFDVQQIGPQGSEIGFATLNGAVRDYFGVNMLWYDITDYLGLLSVAVAFCFALFGLYQIIKGKSIRKVDADIILLGVFYAAVIAAYVLFEVVVINCRPILIAGELEASFPSSHTMLVTCIVGSAIYQFIIRLKNRALRNISVIACIFIICMTVAGRMISGIHWVTDILGGVLLSGALIALYIGACEKMKA